MRSLAAFTLLVAALTAGGTPRALAAPSTATPSPCASPKAAARVMTLVQPAYSTYMRENHKEGTVDVRVYLAANGTVTKAEIAKSSGDAYLDGATYDAAIATTYLAEVKDCISVAGSYIYRTRYRGASDAAPTTGSSPASTNTTTPAPAATPTAPRTRPTTLPTTYATTVPTTLPTTYATTIPIGSGR